MKERKKSVYLSVIVPCYNEEKRVGNIVKILNYLKELKCSWELIVVNDGSSDNTSKVLRSLSLGTKFKIISYIKNRGKGYAVKKGMLRALGKYRLFLDVDLSTPISQLDKFLKNSNKSDVIIGTRRKKGARVVIHQSALREYLGVVFTFLSRMVLGMGVSDFTCGFKMFSGKAGKKIFGNTRIYGWGFDSEALYLAKKYGFSVREIPVVWKNDARTKVRFPQDLVRTLIELFSIRYYDWIRGLY